MSTVFPRLVVALILLGFLIARVVSRRRGTWASGDWFRLGCRLTFSGGLVVLAMLMAFGVDDHIAIAGPGHSNQRMLYVVAMMLMVLYGIVSGVQALFSAAGDEHEPVFFRGYLQMMILFVIVLCLAMLIAERRGISGHRTMLFVVGGFVVGLGVSLPAWVQTMVRGHSWMSRLSPLQVRLVYLGFGFALIGLSVAGPAAWFGQ